MAAQRPQSLSTLLDELALPLGIITHIMNPYHLRLIIEHLPRLIHAYICFITETMLSRNCCTLHDVTFYNVFCFDSSPRSIKNMTPVILKVAHVFDEGADRAPRHAFFEVRGRAGCLTSSIASVGDFS